jgi:DNA polymerase III epsilon subunit-like protein
MMEYVLYVADCETTGLDSHLNDVIETSLLRLSDGQQRTWCLKPINMDNIDIAALRINGHKMADLKWETKEGRERYREAKQVIVEIENWILEDGVPTEQRVLVGQNVGFDREFLTQLWTKCQAADTFPLGRRMVDTMIIEFFLDWCKTQLPGKDFKMAEGYSLSGLVKKYGVTNTKAHTAEADVKATGEVFGKQVEAFIELLKNAVNQGII